MKNKIAKRLLTAALSAAMVLTYIPTTTFAAENDSASGTEADANTNTGSTGIEEGKTYLVPLDLYNDDELYQDMQTANGIIQYMDNVAMVSKNSDGSLEKIYGVWHRKPKTKFGIKLSANNYLT